jgi:uncharacterized protein (DUF1015 family)
LITIRPVKRALIPVNAEAAQRISGSNYDEFQHDEEIWEILQTSPKNILHVTMSHCDVPDKESIGIEGSPEALEHAAQNLQQLIESDLTKIVDNILWVYEIEDNSRDQIRQMGLGGLASTQEIRSENSPSGSIIRNEGVRESKAKGRADLIEKTHAYIGTVNNAIDDTNSIIETALENYADSRGCDYCATDGHGNLHSIWIVDDADQIAQFVKLFESEPYAYVADGNHRSMAAAMLGHDSFLAVFFPADHLGLAPYNRLVKHTNRPIGDLVTELKKCFNVELLGPLQSFAPEQIHEIGLYTNGVWYNLRVKNEAFDPSNAVQSVDAEIVQRNIFDAIFGITDEKDEALTFVGGNKDSEYLKQKVDSGDYEYAISLAPVTMEQFIEVCKQNRFMPPKSTWFMPKIRSGLVMAMLE